MEQPRKGYTIFILSMLLGLATLATLLAVGLLAGQRAARAQEVGELRRALVTQSVQYACDEIERLKAGEREAAHQSFDDLDKNLRLLGLKRTPELVRAARVSRDRKLQRYRKTVCPIPF